MTERMDVPSLLAEIRANRTKLDACDVHRFAPDDYKFGQKMTCLKCGGTMQATDVGHYIKGYEAHGGSCDDIWPGYRKPRESAQTELPLDA